MNINKERITMKTSELFPSIFGLIIRSAGLYVALRGLGDIYVSLLTFIGNMSFENFPKYIFGRSCFIAGPLAFKMS